MEKKLRIFRELFVQHSIHVAGILRAQNFRKEEIEEIMQNAYVKAYREYDKLKNPQAFLSWFTSIAVNEGKLYLRKNMQNRKQVFSIEAAEYNDSLLEEQAWREHHAGDNMELRILLKEAIEKLPVKYRVPFQLGVVEQYKYHEIAEMLNLKEGTVKSRINRAKLMLRQILEE